MIDHKIGTREEWIAAREQLLVREKEYTRLGDEIAQKRRGLPWMRVEKEYRFDTDDGDKTLVELFDGRFQLLVYHFMFGPSYDAGSSAPTDFNYEIGFSRTVDQTREAVPPDMEEMLPPTPRTMPARRTLTSLVTSVRASGSVRSYAMATPSTTLTRRRTAASSF